MPLESSANILQSDSHDFLDQLVIQSISNGDNKVTPGLPALLTTIVGSDDTLNPQYGKPAGALTLLDKEKGLDEMLRDAWSKGKFEEIRNLGAYTSSSTLLHSNPGTQQSFGLIEMIRPAPQERVCFQR